MQVLSTKPLSVDEIKYLNEFLCASYEDSSPMNFTKAHGFLTAINTCPHMIMPSVWQPVLFGGYPEFNSEKQVHTIMDALQRLLNQINDDLKAQDFSFEPIIFNNNEIVSYQTASLNLIAEWCDGYTEGVRLDPLWLSDEEEKLDKQGPLSPLIVMGILAGYLDIEGMKDEKGNTIQDATPYKEKLQEVLPKLVISFFNYWEEARKYPMPLYGEEKPHNRSQPKTGRNDPCHCGSGKKYKKCCALMGHTFH